MTSKLNPEYRLSRADSNWLITFSAMASPCEILIRCNDKSEADRLASLAFLETRRIETKYSRYRNDNIVHQINHSNGAPVRVDEETGRLLDYADQVFRLSDGLFDITSGVLRRAWKFDGSQVTPDEKLIESLRSLVGWERATWDGRDFRLQPGMEIDFGGIGKEYAVDLVAGKIFGASGVSLMANFGGDIRAMMADGDTTPWIVGIEDPGRDDSAVGQIDLAVGGIATSGDLRRFCYVDGVRLGHILNPLTGWPVAEAPRSVTIIGDTCVEAGLLATLAMLQGADAERFIETQGVVAHCIR